MVLSPSPGALEWPVARAADTEARTIRPIASVHEVAARRRRFDELSLPRFAVWGAAGGVLLSPVPAALVAVGLASIGDSALGLWRLTAVVSGPAALLGAASASASLVLARAAEKR